MYGAAGARPRGSSNSFAHGTNQNNGNHITDTPTTRVVAPPGGASSFSLGWDGHDRNARATAGYPQDRSRGDFSVPRSNVGQQREYDDMSPHDMPRRAPRDASTSRQSEHSHPRQMHGYAQGRSTPGRNYDEMSACEMPHHMTRDASTSRRSQYPSDMQNQQYTERSGCGMPPRIPRDRAMAQRDYDEPSGSGPRSSMTFGGRPRESSNTFARGANQNCGNFISDVPTTRVAAPPGGRSSFSLGWGDDCTNERSTKCTDRRAPSYQAEDFEMQRESWAGSSVRTSSNPSGRNAWTHEQRPASEMSGCTPRDSKTFGQRPRESSNTYARGANQNCGNVISDVPTTRVVAPPGGRSSLNLAWGDETSNGRNMVHTPGRSQQQQQYDGKRGSSVRNSSNARMMDGHEEDHGMQHSNARHQPPPSMAACNASQNAQPLDEVSRLKQMFQESRNRMARMKDPNEDFYHGQCPASEASKAYGGAGISRTGSGSTSASGGRYSQSGVYDDAGDVDELPLGAEWSSFYQR
jgi:SPIRAL1-like protein